MFQVLGKGVASIGRKLSKWTKDLQKILFRDSKPPFGTVQPSKNWKWLKQNKIKRGWSQERRDGGVWAPGLEMVKEWLPELQSKLLEAGNEELERSAQHFCDMVKLAIYSQAYKWKPLTERYIKWKKRKGRDTRILISTGEYVQSIEVSQSIEGNLEDVIYTVGLPDKIHIASGLPIRQLAAIHEFGSPKARIPARPVWYPTWRLVMPEVKEKVSKRLRQTAFEEAEKFQLKLQKALPGVTVKVKQG